MTEALAHWSGLPRVFQRTGDNPGEPPTVLPQFEETFCFDAGFLHNYTEALPELLPLAFDLRLQQVLAAKWDCLSPPIEIAVHPDQGNRLADARLTV